MTNTRPILSIRNLSVVLDSDAKRRTVINNLSLDIPRGQTVALVGESGSGKTLAALAVLGLLPEVATTLNGSISFNGKNMLTLPDSELQELRGDRIGMIFQEPGTSLNPLISVGKQIGESLQIHKGLGKRIIKEQVLALMELVGIPDPERRYRSLPQQLSGGVRQRVVIAMALACRPELLLADEPTTALDSTVQAQILDLLSRLIQDLRMSVFLISHDLGVVASLADRVAVLHSGQIVEEGSVRKILKVPLHPYSQMLLKLNPFKRNTNSGVKVTVLSPRLSPQNGGTDFCSMVGNCPYETERCSFSNPELVKFSDNHSVRCHNVERAND